MILGMSFLDSLCNEHGGDADGRATRHNEHLLDEVSRGLSILKSLDKRANDYVNLRLYYSGSWWRDIKIIYV